MSLVNSYDSEAKKGWVGKEFSVRFWNRIIHTAVVCLLDTEYPNQLVTIKDSKT